MASFLYAVAEKGFLDADIDLLVDTIKVRAVTDTTYTPSEAHTAMSSVTAYAGTTDPTISTSKTTTAGVFDAADISAAWSSVSQDSSNLINGLVIYKFVTDDAGSTPIAYIDLTTSFTPNGGDINLNFNASGIFSIAA